MLSIRTNLASLNAQNHIYHSGERLSKSFERLSSGFRINSAADDAAGLAVSESLRAQIRSFAVAERNANNGISMVNTAEAGLGEISSIVIRMRELAVQASNGDLSAANRSYIDTEYQSLIEEIDRVASSTEFNGVALLAGPSTTIAFQVGINTTAADQISVDFGDTSVATMGLTGTNVAGADATASQAAITAIDGALDALASRRAGFGAATNRLSTSVSAAQTIATNLSAANSRIRDVDMAHETAEMAKAQILQQAGASMLAQANQAPQLAMQLLG
ncbi:MAG: flagellin FliC [Myxococcales bacterium]|nr:flagellin FliC [Myxococcales bacterium]